MFIKVFFPYCLFVKNEFQPLAIRGPEATCEGGIEEGEENETKSIAVLRERISCKICFENEVSVRLNCKHIVTCKDCSLKVKACPVCRCIINERIDVILS